LAGLPCLPDLVERRVVRRERGAWSVIRCQRVLGVPWAAVVADL